MNALLTAGCTTGLAFLLTATVLPIGPEQSCKATGGRWASAQEVCVTSSCFESGSCGKWVYPAERCNQLKIGDHRAEVYFQLGDPDQVLQNEARWQAEKGSPELVVATFSTDRLASLSCPKAAQ
jgi:hypothetical protein